MTLTEFLRTARLHGLSDTELQALERLFRAADEWQKYMRHVGDANNFNGTLYRAIDVARHVFGDVDRHDPHMHCRINLSAGDHFARELKRLRRRMARITALKNGDASLHKVTVRGGWVKRHYRTKHTRLLIVLNK